MKKPSILQKILLPIVTILFLLPLLSCLIFYIFAMQYAYKQSSNELESLNKSIISAMERNLSYKKSSNKENRQNKQDIEDKQDIKDKPDSFENFLSQIVLMASGNSGNARLIILSGENHVIYPRNISEYPEIQQLANDFISLSKLNNSRTIIEIKASDGQKYLITMHKAVQNSVRFSGVITYCPTELIGSWVEKASLIVFIISTISTTLVFIALWVTVNSITKPLNQLCIESNRIGYGDFHKIDTSFSLKEPETLRLAMNRMAEQLKQSDSVQKLFFQNVSHELRNPLMSISGYAQGIEQNVFADYKAAAHTILEESTRLTEIVGSLLTLSRLYAHEFVPDIRIINIKDVIDNCLDKVYGLAMQKKIILSFESLYPDLEAACDEELLEKIIDNLLSNAVRYAKNQISVSTQALADKIHILVSDDGPGISKEDLPHIFERCYKGAGGNYGIGLAIADSAANLMNATIYVQNLPQGGACFTIILPIGILPL